MLERHGRHVAALVPMADFARLEARDAPRKSATRGAGAGRLLRRFRELPRLGPVLLAASDAGLWRLSFGRSRAALEDRLARGACPRRFRATRPCVRRAEKELREYLGGRRRRFDVPVDPAAYRTPFLRRGAARRDLRDSVRRASGPTATSPRRSASPAAARAVGGALGRNPVPDRRARATA